MQSFAGFDPDAQRRRVQRPVEFRINRTLGQVHEIAFDIGRQHVVGVCVAQSVNVIGRKLAAFTPLTP